MLVNELLYLLNKELKSSIKEHSNTSRYIIKAYNNIYEKIKNKYQNNENINTADIHKMDISENMKIKLISLLYKTIKISDIKKITLNKLFDDLTIIQGIGKIKANELIKSGVKNINDLENEIYFNMLNKESQSFLEYKPITKIAHSDIKKIENKLTGYPNTTIVGGYRRGKPFSKDIDVMYVSDNSIDEYIKYLKNTFNDIYIYKQGINKVSMFIFIKKVNIKNIYYKLDIFRTSVKCQYPMLMYSTGSKEFNIKMRLQAAKMGYLLNQKGLFKKKNMEFIEVDSEKDLLKKINMEYVNPIDR